MTLDEFKALIPDKFHGDFDAMPKDLSLSDFFRLDQYMASLVGAYYFCLCQKLIDEQFHDYRTPELK